MIPSCPPLSRRRSRRRSTPVLGGAIALLALALSLAPAPLATGATTANEQAWLLDHLERSQSLFLRSVEGLTEEQWSFKPSEDRWSIAEVAEHITISESVIREMTESVVESPALEQSEVTDVRKEDQVLAFILDRSQKVQAPEAVTPDGRFKTSKQMLKEFRSARAKTFKLARTDRNLRLHAGEHPAFGMMDAYGWLIFLSGHTERHTNQIEEVKALPGYPQG